MSNKLTEINLQPGTKESFGFYNYIHEMFMYLMKVKLYKDTNSPHTYLALIVLKYYCDQLSVGLEGSCGQRWLIWD